MNNLAILAPCFAFHSCFIVFSAFCSLVLICSVFVVCRVPCGSHTDCWKLVLWCVSLALLFRLFIPTLLFTSIIFAIVYFTLLCLFRYLPSIFNYVGTFELRKKTKKVLSLCIFSALFNISKNGEDVKNYVV